MSIGLDTVLGMLRGVHRSGDKATARCPAHDDRTPSLSVKAEDDGRILLKCHAGCLTEEVLAALGLNFEDVAPDRQNGNGYARMNGNGTRARGRLTIATLAKVKGFTNSDWLRERFSLREDSFGVVIPYFDADGKLIREQVRTGLKKEPGGRKIWRWNRGGDLIPYGVWLLGEARQRGELHIVEGASDVWTLALHNMSALGLPGGATAKLLKPEQVTGIKRITHLTRARRNRREVRARRDRVPADIRVHR